MQGPGRWRSRSHASLADRWMRALTNPNLPNGGIASTRLFDGSILRGQGLGPGDILDVRTALETAQLHPSEQSGQLNGAVSFALYRVFGVFALILTCVGMPMFLAGEEFGDVHDLDFSND
jgi:hypothetical protein